MNSSRSYSAGFTLIELGLAITIGLILLAGGVLGYQQAHDHAGDAAARQKVADLHGLVEDNFTRTGAFPTLATLRAQWGAQRLGDATASPWGGPVVMADATDSTFNGIEGLDAMPQPLPAPLGGAASEQSRNSGLLYYYRIQVPGQPPAADGWRMWEVNTKSYLPIRGYAVAANKNYRAYFFVTSGR
ncbi:MAG: prepilin-type N-terminal cleavage/methylation domain-containing protein [Cyanobacteria bacterium NC_groundwater_1444_Ag_S-0.65um_54_12]|nr:prepilin-type N-terminal cleavage/methylation domain-containing protein [Cyanobacteria bacterium NC_groundwater_1444_Ag_S-0.65um_54_12]